MSLLVKIITFIVLTSPIFAPRAFADQNISYDPSFKEEHHPDPWTPGATEICFVTRSTGSDCAKVTTMGEIMLRQNGQTADDINKKYIATLSPESQKVVNKYNTLFVRYLSLDGVASGRYIVQIFYTLLNVPYINDYKQAIYLYGNFAASVNGDSKSINFDPQGYGDIPDEGKYGWRAYGRGLTRVNAEKLIAVTQHVLYAWAEDHISELTSPPQTPKP